ncbi:TIGR00366 family protein [Bacillus sonorensis]|uniref:YfcC family protein n=1 Tax=Bacillus sonorensis TaxID=119858 RepID=UPI002282E13E|nr:TIGR00366 family protein [Bacillus sonorensis]MCZ0068844.1 TIGR00366 family protein [Bacillus sonorensis]MCZ0095238.1 TIGR00366 family protein [Bacillus sonorensis]MEC1518183.1 TIGR00366 family protein [Bacillus sonorensis]
MGVPAYQTEELKKNQKRKKEFPHIYVILAVMIVVMALATYIIPSGEYERVESPDGREMIDPDSYQRIEQSPVGLLTVLSAVPQGMTEAAPIIFFTFVAGGVFAVLRKAMVIELGVRLLGHMFRNRPALIIPVLMFVFSGIACFIGTPELSIVYVPVILPLMLSFGYDRMTAAAIALCGTIAGFTSALTNPFTVGISQMISGVPLYSGMGYRTVIFFVITAVAAVYVLKYAEHVRAHPETSLTGKEEAGPAPAFSAGKRVKWAGAAALACFMGLIGCVIYFRWDMVAMAGYFLALGIIPAVIAGMNSKEIAESFNEGFKEVLVGAMVCGIARAVAVVMTEGQIMDTIVYGLSHVVSQFPSYLTVAAMLFTQMLFNFFVPSGSGQALIMMPIMAPLADIVGITRQTAILAFQFGDGFSNIVFPTSGYFMATLAISRIPWNKWLTFILPLFCLWMAAAVVFLMIAHAAGWS